MSQPRRHSPGGGWFSTCSTEAWAVECFSAPDLVAVTLSPVSPFHLGRRRPRCLGADRQAALAVGAAGATRGSRRPPARSLTGPRDRPLFLLGQHLDPPLRHSDHSFLAPPARGSRSAE